MNDNSTMAELYEPLEKYLKDNFNGKAKLFHNPLRKGAIVSRMEAAERATGEVRIS